MQERSRPSIFSRLATVILTLSVATGAVATVAFGSDMLAERAQSVPAPDAADLTPVSIQTLAYEDSYLVTRTYLGQVEAGADATLSFELGGKLAVLTVEEGHTVTEGEVIGRLDVALLRAEQQRLEASLAATQAQMEFAEARLVRATELHAEGFSSQETLDQARANRDELTGRLGEIEAALLSVEINLDKSVLRAPFSGQVGTQTAEIGETVGAGQTILQLIKTGAPRVRLGLPLNLPVDALETSRIELNGQTFDATLDQIRPDIDPVTRTRTALFTFETDTPPAFGETVTLSFDLRTEARGAWVPIDALQEGAGSLWTILVVDEGTVKAAAAELVHMQRDRAFVRGSFPDNAKLIRAGAHRVVPGQRVTITDVAE